MKRVLRFEAVVSGAGGELLVQVAAVLRGQGIDPEALSWSSWPPNGPVSVRLVLTREDGVRLPALAERIAAISGVRNVTCDFESAFMD